MIGNVIEAMVDAVLVVDGEGRITLANTAAARLTGYALDALRGRPLADLLVDDSSLGLLVTQTGERIPISLTAGPLVGATGTPEGIVLVARDTRERSSLLVAERRAALGTIAGGVGHELRNIAQIQMTAVDRLQEALDAGADVTELVRSLIGDLERVGDHIAQHGKHLVQLAHPASDTVSVLDLRTVIDELVAMLRFAGRLRFVTIEVDVEPGLAVYANRTRCEQIFINLVGNAVDAIGPNTTSPTITITAASAGERARCSVHDGGPGIPPHLLDQIFVPYFTTKGNAGTGLGLPVVREIVGSYGGVIAVDCSDGTTFTFDLPRVAKSRA